MATTVRIRQWKSLSALCSSQMLRILPVRSFSHQINGKIKEEEPDKPNSDASARHQSFLKGIVLDHAVNLQNVRPGDRVDIPYEVTISETMQDFWFGAFFDQSRIHTSRPFCR